MIIDDLPSISIANDSDEIAIEQGTATKKITKGNFLQEIVSSISSLISDISGKVSKAGDTMSGDLLLSDASCISQDSRITSGTTPSSNIYGRSFYLNDRQRFNIGTWQIMSLTNGRDGFQLVGAKKVNNVNKYNYIRMLVDANGNPVVELNGAAAWRSALGLCYAANDTYSSGTTIISGIVTNNAKRLLFIATVDKSLENISTVTVTDLHGHTAGVAGVIDGNSSSSDDLKNKSGYTVTATKINNNTVRIQIDKSTALTNTSTATPFTIYGYFTLKFT